MPPALEGRFAKELAPGTTELSERDMVGAAADFTRGILSAGLALCEFPEEITFEELANLRDEKKRKLMQFLADQTRILQRLDMMGHALNPFEWERMVILDDGTYIGPDRTATIQLSAESALRALKVFLIEPLQPANHTKGRR